MSSWAKQRLAKGIHGYIRDSNSFQLFSHTFCSGISKVSRNTLNCAWSMVKYSHYRSDPQGLSLLEIFRDGWCAFSQQLVTVSVLIAQLVRNKYPDNNFPFRVTPISSSILSWPSVIFLHIFVRVCLSIPILQLCKALQRIFPRCRSFFLSKSETKILIVRAVALCYSYFINGCGNFSENWSLAQFWNV